MTGNLRVAAASGLFAALGLGACGGDGSGHPAAPPPTTPPPPSEPPPPPEYPPEHLVAFQLATSLAPANGAPVRLTEGGGFYAEVRVLRIWLSPPLAGSEADFELDLATDAPPDELRVPYAVRPRFPRANEMGLATIPIEAPADDRFGEADAEYTIRLLPPAGGLPEGMMLEDAPLRVVVVDSPPVECGGLRVSARFRGSRPGSMKAAELTLTSPHPDASVSIVGDYERKVLDYPWAGVLFPTGFGTVDSGLGFRATIPFRWFALRHRVELDAQLPGCPPITVRCDSGCSVN